jgi:hypothetical protein
MLRSLIMRLLGTNTRRLIALLLLAAALVGTLAGCGGSDDDVGAAATTAPGSTALAGDRGWKRVVPGGDCQCADGSEFNFWVREANPAKVVFYLGGGGACFSAETCADGDLYKTTVEDDPTQQGGMFHLDDERNPFADYSIVYLPYCTGDVHIGDTTKQYAPGLTIRHKGFVNGTAALDRLAAAFSGATEVIVVGESAGSVAAPLYAGLISDRLPDARISVLGDGSGSYPEGSRTNEVFAAWGVGNAVPDWPENARLTAGQWSPSRFVIQSARHDPEIVFARHDHASDDEQELFGELLGVPATNLLSRIEANEAQIESAGVKLLSYVGPGDEHVILSDGPFYRETVAGVKLVDWVTRLIEGQAVEDVRCQRCRAG